MDHTEKTHTHAPRALPPPAATLVLLLATLLPTVASAQHAPQATAPQAVTTTAEHARPTEQTLEAFGAASYLASPGLNGAGLLTGVRWGIGPYFAVSFDVGYGLLGSSAQVEDRWWLMPSVALVIPAGDLRVDVGVGLGLGETSGFRYFQELMDRPFVPDWSFQLVPEVRGHAIVSTRVSDGCTAFARVDVASVLLDGNDLGIRDGDPHRDPSDTLWVTLSVGTSFRFL